MVWPILAILSTLFYALTNYVDKYLVFKFSDDKSVGSLVLYSSLFSLVTLSLVLFFGLNSNINIFGITNKHLLILSGLSQFIAIVLYLKSIFQDEVIVVMLAFLTIPIFSLIFDLIFFKTIPTLMSIVGAFLVLVSVCAIVISGNSQTDIYIRKGAILLAIYSSLFYSISYLLFKFATNSADINFWAATFWEQLGIFISGLIIFFCASKYRKDFINSIKRDGIKIFGVNIVGEILQSLGNLSYNYAIVLAPLFLVSSISVTQQIFVIIIGLIIATLTTNYFKEDMSKDSIKVKLAWSLVAVFGTILII